MNKKSFVIGVSGATGSGKSWFAKQVKDLASDSIGVFTLDSYYKNNNYVNCLKYRHDNPDAINYDFAIVDLQNIINGHSIRVPQYDYETHKVIKYDIKEPMPIIIVEGLFAFSDERLRHLMDFLVWIEADYDVRLQRRINRDINERGDTIDSATERFTCDAEPAFQEIISINKQYADCVIFNNGNNHVSKTLLMLKNLLQ